jgi:hypothetical protein
MGQDEATDARQQYGALKHLGGDLRASSWLYRWDGPDGAEYGCYFPGENLAVESDGWKREGPPLPHRGLTWIDAEPPGNLERAPGGVDRAVGSSEIQ